jgi:TolB-like protein
LGDRELLCIFFHESTKDTREVSVHVSGMMVFKRVAYRGLDFVRRYAFIAITLFLFLGLSSHVFGKEEATGIKTVAVMPFTAFAKSDRSIDLTRLVTDFFVKHNFRVISQDVLEGFLAKKRIRRSDFLDRSTIREMNAELKADALITGSATLLAKDKNPLVSINAQMIECVDASIVWANSASCTGEDFITFLGLGKITSLKKLAGVVVDNLFESLPKSIDPQVPPILPFEVVQASFSPKVLRGGKRVNLSIEVRNINGQIQDIRAFILDTKIDLKTKDARWYTGAFTAPTIEGVYPLKLYVTNRWNKLFTIDAVATLEVHNVAPDIALFCQERLISPNNDGVNDYIQFFPKILKAAALESWRFEIKDKDGNLVRSEDGFGMLPEGFVWRGRNNRNNKVKDGTYFYRLITADKAGNVSVTPEETLMVDTTAPEVQLFLVSKDEEEITLNVQTEDMNKIAGWELTIFDSQGNEAEKLEGNGDIPTSIKLAEGLKGKLEDGRLEGKNLPTYFLYVSDVAGNRLEVTKQPLKQVALEKTEGGPEKREKIWVDDF